LAELSLLAVNRGYVDDAPELACPHAFNHRAAHIEKRVEVRGNDFVPLRPGHLMQGAVSDDPGIVHQDIDRPDGGFNFPDARDAGFEIAGVPAVHSGTRFRPEGPCRDIVAGIGRGHAIPGFEQSLGDGGTDAACSASDQCNPRHFPSFGQSHTVRMGNDS